MMGYKSYIAEVEIDDERGVLHGRVVNTRDVITFEGRSVDELRQAMADSIEDYLEYCRELGRAPDKPFSGRFQVRVSPDLHRRVHAAAKVSGMSMNTFVSKVLDAASSSTATQVPNTLAANAGVGVETKQLRIGEKTTDPNKAIRSARRSPYKKKPARAAG